jgi:hypothetical protein
MCARLAIALHRVQLELVPTLALAAPLLFGASTTKIATGSGIGASGQATTQFVLTALCGASASLCRPPER